jgi:protein TonB
MANKVDETPGIDDIVFKDRNKDYGAYMLRKRYARSLMISISIGIMIVSSASIIQFISVKSLKGNINKRERLVEIKMDNLDKPEEVIAPPPPPPPAPEIIKQSKYVAPVIVDSVKSLESAQLMSTDDAMASIEDEKVVDYVEQVKPKEEVQEEKEETEPFLVVQEMPEPPGGLAGLLKYISEHLVYPREALENNIQGKVFVKFCVTATGEITRPSIYKGVDPGLDSAALKVVSTFPPFKPGKQAGRPVPVWYIVQINFELN